MNGHRADAGTLTTFKITLAYDGTGLVGWQRQASGISVQGLLEDALLELDRRRVIVAGAGRTDAGVHAFGQVASFSLEREIDPATLVRALNARLPAALRVLQATIVPPTFHARFDASAKTYCYRLWIDPVMDPFERAYAWHLPYHDLDVAAMAAAARLLEGRHDFAAFQAAGTRTRTTERVVTSSRLLDRDSTPHPAFRTSHPALRTSHGGRLITYAITADGFLRHMVRTMIGSLVEVGRRRRPSGWVGEVLASRRRELAGPTAPPHGLFLVAVMYQPRAAE